MNHGLDTAPSSLQIQQPVIRSSRRVSMSSDKALNGGSGGLRPTFEPYPQSMPVSMAGVNGAAHGTKKKTRRPSETAAVLCQHCGKNYKHQQCLVKHLWEHSPYWSSIPNSQPLSKHQKVQLLETASILCKLSGSPNLTNGGGLSLSPSPFGTSQISNADFNSRDSGIILEADDEIDELEEEEEDDSGEAESLPGGGSSVAVDDDDDPGVFGRMES